MRIASIDIGTNTLLLLIADIDSNRKILPLHHEQRIPRIGKDVDERKIIQQPAFERVESILLEYREIIDKYSVDRIVACATSAVRDASNRFEFVEYIRKSTGFNIEILSGEDEAYLTYLGALSNLEQSETQYLVIDIGGGSTEISYKGLSNNFKKYSLQLGSVRLTERYLKHNPPTADECKQAVESIWAGFSNGSLDGKTDNKVKLVGVAGTVTTLACFELGLMEFDVEKVSGLRLSRSAIQKWYDKLILLPNEEIRKLSRVTEGRADILTAGTMILFEFMKQFDFQEIIVSERGLRYGMAMITSI